MAKKRTLHFVNTSKGTYSQHWKKTRAKQVQKKLKNKGIKSKIISKSDYWTY